MPRRSKEINPFDGGLNNFSDPRDIEDNELAEATNVDTSNAGRLRVGDTFNVTGSAETFGTPLRGRGLFHYNSDYTKTQGEGDTEYLLMTDVADSSVWRQVVGETTWTEVDDTWGNSPDTDYYVVDGAVRFSDKDAVDNHAVTNDTRFLGVSKQRLWNTGTPAVNLISDKAYIYEPYAGKVVFNSADPVNESIDDGTLLLDLQEKTGSKDTWTNDFNYNPLGSITTINGDPTLGAGSLNGNSGESNSSSEGMHGKYTSMTIGSGWGGDTITAPSGGSTKFLSIVKSSSSSDYVKTILRFIVQKDYTDKSIFIKIYVANEAKANMTDVAFKVRIGNDIANTGTSSNDCYLYYVGQSQITSDDWTEIEFKYGEHDEVEGSPNAASIDQVAVEAVFSSDALVHSNAGQFSFAIADVAVGESTRGLWNGWYKWFYSWIYDKKQESKTKELAGQSSHRQIENKILQAKVQAKDSSSAWEAGSNNAYTKRITGANVYYAEYDLDGNPLDEDKKLFMNVDFERGVKKPGEETYTVWNTSAIANSSHTQNTYVQYFDTPLIDTFQTTAGYVEDDKLDKVKFKTSAVMNRRAYVGDVRVWESGQADAQTIRYSDRIYKSEPNMFDVFTELGYIDVAINDGDTITALMGYGDYLLQFKKRTMYLINVTQDIEYLEKQYEFRGVWGQGAVCKIPEGIAWVNDYGAFLFNGNEVIDLLGKKIDRIVWEQFVGTDPIIGFKPLTQDIVILSQCNAGTVYLFNIPTESWTHHNINQNQPIFSGLATNMVTLNDGTLKMFTDYSNDLKVHKWDDPSGDQYLIIQTKDQTLGDPAQRKTLKKIYISHKGTGTMPTAKYITDNGGTSVARTLTNSTTNNGTFPASSTYTMTAFTPTDATQANNKYSYQVYITGDADPSFVINDINLVYRDKTLK